MSGNVIEQVLVSVDFICITYVLFALRFAVYSGCQIGGVYYELMYLGFLLTMNILRSPRDQYKIGFEKVLVSTYAYGKKERGI